MLVRGVPPAMLQPKLVEEERGVRCPSSANHLPERG
jgi:hypothetical protein